MKHIYSLFFMILLTVTLSSCFGGDDDGGDAPIGSSQISAPANVQASDGIYNNAIKISWDAVPGATEYGIYRGSSETIETNQGPILNNITGTEAYDFSVLTDDMYYYTVVAYDSNYFQSPAGTADLGSTSATGTTKLVPDPVISATKGTLTNQIILTWNQVPEAQNYSLYFTTVMTDSSSNLATSPFQCYDNGSFVYVSVSISEISCSDGSCTYTKNTTSNDPLYFWIQADTNGSALSPWAIDYGFIQGGTDPGGISVGQDDTAFLLAYTTAFNNIATKILSATDGNTDPYISEYTVTGDTSGSCVMTMTIAVDGGGTPTGASTTSYVFNNYNDDGTIFNGTLTMSLDTSSNGSFTGTITATGNYTGSIEYHVTFTGGVGSGYYTINGVNYSYTTGQPL